jgi:hypothetical protein
MMPRVVAPEVLDNLPADDPAARRSRRDLLRIHGVMGTRSIVARGWRSLLRPARAGAPLRILELGAGDGRFSLGVARALAGAWPPVELHLMDRQDIITPATLAGFGALGWTTRLRVDDVLAWAARPGDPPGALPSPRWDLVTTTLFLHHFDSPALAQLLAAVAKQSDRFFACEPGRTCLSLAGSRLVGAIGANAVTREDAVLSVRAGFRHREISAHWPAGGGRWQTREGATGLFSHCFSAWRVRGAA